MVLSLFDFLLQEGKYGRAVQLHVKQYYDGADIGLMLLSSQVIHEKWASSIRPEKREGKMEADGIMPALYCIRYHNISSFSR